MTEIQLAGEAWLYRNGKATWHFVPDPTYGELVHITRQGNVYAILAGHKIGKPFWIGLLSQNGWITCEAKQHRMGWISCEDRLEATSIVFGSGGMYRFPSR